MNMSTKASRIVRSEGDPRIIESGPSSRGLADRAAKGLGWFSIGLGLAELFATKRLTRALGMEGSEALIRAYGAREILAGVTCLSTEQKAGVWSRVAGDAVDIATLAYAYGDENPKKQSVGIALGVVAAVTLVDLATAQGLAVRHGRRRGEARDFSDRSGWPGGLERARGAAANFRKPEDMRADPAAAAASPVTGRTSPAATPLVQKSQPAL